MTEGIEVQNQGKKVRKNEGHIQQRKERRTQGKKNKESSFDKRKKERKKEMTNIAEWKEGRKGKREG